MTETERGLMIRDARHHLGITQTEMSKKLNLTPDALYKYESGKNRIPIDTAGNYCEILGIPAERMLGITEVAADRDPINEFVMFQTSVLDWIRKEGSLSMELLFTAIWELINNLMPEETHNPQTILKFLQPDMFTKNHQSDQSNADAIFAYVKSKYPDSMCLLYWGQWKACQDKDGCRVRLWYYLLERYRDIYEESVQREQEELKNTQKMMKEKLRIKQAS